MASPAWAQVAFDNATAGATAGVQTSLTVALLTAGSNRALIVTCATDDGQTPTVTYAGTSMSQVNTSLNGARATMFSLANEASGTNDIICSVGGAATNLAITAFSFTNVDQTTPVRTNAINNGATTAISITITANSGEFTVDGYYTDFTPNNCAQETPDVSQGNKQCASAQNNTINGQGSTKANATTAMQWTQTNNGNWAGVAAVLQPPTGGGATPSPPTRTLLGVGQ